MGQGHPSIGLWLHGWVMTGDRIVRAMAQALCLVLAASAAGTCQRRVPLAWTAACMAWVAGYHMDGEQGMGVLGVDALYVWGTFLVCQALLQLLRH